MPKATQSELRLARRMSRLGTETAFEVLVKARALEAKGRDIVHLEIGEPDFDTPRNVIDAGVKALQGGWTHYGPSAGLPKLREAVAHDAGGRRGVRSIPLRWLSCRAASPSFSSPCWPLIEEGDEVIYPNPGFPIYESMIDFVGGKARPGSFAGRDGFRLDVGELAALITDRTKVIILNSPQNPTGGMMTEQDVRDLAGVIGDRDSHGSLRRIYSRLIFEGKHSSIMSVDGMKDRTILLDGFSKTYAMTGWAAWATELCVRSCNPRRAAVTNSNSCTASFTQVAGIEALNGDQASVDNMNADSAAAATAFTQVSIRSRVSPCLKPKGAFYMFPNIKETGWPSKKLADALLDDAGVACLSGTAFGAFGRGIPALQRRQFHREHREGP